MTRTLYTILLAALAPLSHAAAVVPVPELDPSGALGVVALLGGLVALAAERHRRRKVEVTKGRTR